MLPLGAMLALPILLAPDAGQAPTQLEAVGEPDAEAAPAGWSAALEANTGQWPSWVEWGGRIDGLSVALHNQGIAVFPPGEDPVTIEFDGAAAVTPRIRDGAGVSNWFVGETAWRPRVPRATAVVYENAWPGIDVVVRINAEGRLEIDHDLAPGAGPGQIVLRTNGHLEAGGLVLPGGLRLDPPQAFQGPASVSVAFTAVGEGRFGYALGGYDSARALLIDPVLRSSGFIGNSGDDVVRDMVVRDAGVADEREVILVGQVYSTSFPPGFPVNRASPSTPASTVHDAFVAKYSYNIRTRALMPHWISYLGSTGPDDATAVAFDAAGNIGVTGLGGSANFPRSNSAVQMQGSVTVYNGGVAHGSGDAFATVLRPDGTILSSSLIGGNMDDIGRGVAFLSPTRLAIAGETNTNACTGAFCPTPAVWPVTSGAPQPSPSGSGYDGAVSVIDFSTTPPRFTFGTFLQSSGTEQVRGLVGTAAGNIIVAGTVSLSAGATSFPTTSGSFMPSGTPAVTNSLAGFVTAYNTALTGYSYSTLVDGSGVDEIHSLSVDSVGQAWIAGSTASSDLPMCPGTRCAAGAPNSAQSAMAGSRDAFVLGLATAGNAAVFSTYHGGSQPDAAYDLALDATGHVLVVGDTMSANLPLALPVQTTRIGPQDAFIARFVVANGTRWHSTYLGGSDAETAYAVAGDGHYTAYVGGQVAVGGAGTFPLQNPVQGVFGGGSYDGFFSIVGKQGPTAVFHATPTGGGALPSVPAATLSVPSGTDVDLDAASSLAGDFPVDHLQDRWVLTEAGSPPAVVTGGPLSPLSPLSAVGARIVQVCLTVFDASGSSYDGDDTSCMTIEWTNAPPTILDDTFILNEDTSAGFDPRLNDQDPEGGALTLVDVQAMTPLAGRGSITWNAAQLTFNPEPDYYNVPDPNGIPDPIELEYTVADPENQQATGRILISVVNVNDPPRAFDDAFTILEDSGSVSLDVLQNDDSLPDPSEPLGIQSVSGPHVVLVGGQVVYTPPPDFHGTTTFQYTAQDAGGATGSATATVTVLEVNDAPVARDDGFFVAEDSMGNVLDVLSNDDSGPDSGETLRVVAVAGSGGVLVDGQVRYTPPPDFHGTDSLQYTLEDGRGGTAEATATIVVTNTNDPPTAVADSFIVLEDSGATSLPVLVNDAAAPDPGENLTVVSFTAASHGVVDLVDGAIRFTPPLDFVGVAAFTYAASDGNGGTASALVTVNVQNVNDAPQAQPDLVPVLPETSAQFLPVLLNDMDIDGDALSVFDHSSPALGALAPAPGGLLYSAPAGIYSGDVVFWYNATDGAQRSAAPVTLRIGFLEPIADVRTPTTSVCIGDPIPFHAVAGAQGRRVFEWRWDFAGTPLVVPGAGATDSRGHVFTAAGPHAVILEAQLVDVDDPSDAVVVVDEVTVQARGCLAPAADFTFARTGREVRFEDASTDPDSSTLSYLWEFGDGTSLTQQDPIHLYDGNGFYEVRLTVTDGDGNTAFVQKRVLAAATGGGNAPVHEAPAARREAEPRATAQRGNSPPIARAERLDAGSAIVLDGSASSDLDGDALTFLWTQTDGPPVVVLDAASPRASFAPPMGPTVLRFRLLVHDGTTSDTADAEIVIPAPARPGPPMVPTVEADPTNPARIHFHGAGTWHYGDGMTGSEGEHEYAAPGTYLVTLQRSDGTVAWAGQVRVPQPAPAASADLDAHVPAAPRNAAYVGALVALAAAAVLLGGLLVTIRLYRT